MALPAELTEILPPQTAWAWEHIAPILPPSCRLAGGTALAAYLHHRQSRDLAFFYTDPDLDLDALRLRLSGLGPFAVSSHAPGTLNGILRSAKLQFLDAHDEIDLDKPEPHAGILVSSLADVFAMKVKVIGDRGELRDYFDLMRIGNVAHRCSYAVI